MLKLNFLLVLRQLKKNKKSFIINVVGSSIGLTAIVLMTMYIYYESNYDAFNQNVDRLFRVERTVNDKVQSQIFDSTPYELAKELKTTLPEIQEAASVRTTTNYFSIDDVSYPNEVGIIADNSFLKMFSLEFLSGEKHNALARPMSLALSESLANKLFPGANVLGKTVRFNKKNEFTVTGVFTDFPKDSHIRMDYMISFNSYETMNGYKKEKGWNTNYSCTYVLLDKNAQSGAVSGKIRNLLENHVNLLDGDEHLLGLRPIADVYLKTLDVRADAMAGLRNNMIVIYLFMVVALFTAFVTTVNYINLTTTQLVNRELEIGMKKVLGISKNQLRAQFILESLLVVGSIVLVSTILVLMLLPVFDSVVQRNLYVSFAGGVWFFLKILLVILVLGILGGIYPVLYLSSLKITSFLQGNTSIKRRSYLRKGLVLFQLFITIPLIFLSNQTITQINYLNSKDVGFSKENLLLAWVDTSTDENRERLDVIKNTFEQNPRVLNYSVSQGAPFFGSGSEQKVNWEGSGTNNKVRISSYAVDYEFKEAYKMDLVEGRWFSEKFSTDKIKSCVINETAAALMGWEDPIGKTIDNDRLVVVGVVKDYNQFSLYEKIPPMLLTASDFNSDYSVVSIRVDANDRTETKKTINNTFNTSFVNTPIEFRFLDEGFDEGFMSALQNVMRIFILFSIISIVLVIIGLYSLISFSIQKQKKMIAIRKVLGASTSGLFKLIIKEYMILYTIAMVISFTFTLLAYLKISQVFVDGVGLGPMSIINVIFITLFIVLLTISGKIWSATKENPINAITME